jgi:hypothetical protein
MPASPLLLLVPYRYKAAVLYSQIPISASASGDFVVSRAGDTASRILGNGNIETGVLANIARINYPRTGVASGCAGLLVEPSATNLLFYSEGFGNVYWTKTNVTVQDNVSASPANTLTADNVYPTVSGTDVRIQRSFTVNSGTTYTVSTFIKANGVNWIRFFGPEFIGRAAWFNVLSGTIGVVQSGITAKIENYGNGWYRVSVTQTAASTKTGQFYINLADGDGTSTITANGTNGVLLWGAQLEVGSIATSYIPTTTGTVTRNSDVITNNQFVIPNLIGAILTEFESPTSGTYFVDNLPVTLVSGYNKVAISYTPTTITVYRNGTQVSGSPFSPPGGVLPILGNVINIGHNNQYYQLGANIRSFVLYSSTLTAAEASGLTT